MFLVAGMCQRILITILIVMSLMTMIPSRNQWLILRRIWPALIDISQTYLKKQHSSLCGNSRTTPPIALLLTPLWCHLLPSTLTIHHAYLWSLLMILPVYFSFQTFNQPLQTMCFSFRLNSKCMLSVDVKFHDQGPCFLSCMLTSGHMFMSRSSPCKGMRCQILLTFKCIRDW